MADDESREDKNKSRKYRLALLSLVLSCACFGATAFSDRLGDNFGTVVMAISTVLGLYGGANVGHHYVMQKHGKSKTPEGEDEESEQMAVDTIPPPVGKP